MICCPHCNGTGEIDAPPPSALERAHLSEFWFDAFWRLYPRKVSKLAALKAWKKVATSEEIKDEIMLGLSRAIPAFREHIAKDGRQYIPHAATWLNTRKWEG